MQLSSPIPFEPISPEGEEIAECVKSVPIYGGCGPGGKSSYFTKESKHCSYIVAPLFFYSFRRNLEK